MRDSTTEQPQSRQLPAFVQILLDGIPGILAWVALIFCILAAIWLPELAIAIAAILAAYSAIRFLLAAIANQMGIRRVRQWETTDFYEKYQADKQESSLEWDVVKHIVIIPNYKEPDDILRRTLDNLRDQYEASKRITIVLAMEAAEPESDAKGRQLQAEYQDSFEHFYYAVHPQGLPGEMQCKSANQSWSANWVKRKLVDELGYDINHICVTTMDADTRFHPQHFFALTYLFAINPRRYNHFWQAPIRYHGNIWEINPLMRLVNAYATAFEMAYLAAPWWQALPMSSYSLSLKLLTESGGWSKDVIADEWHMYIKSFFASRGDLDLEPIFLPFLADAVTGENFLKAVKERYLQTVRHAWGSKEVGYTLAKTFQPTMTPFRRSFKLLFRISHDILLAGPGWIILTVGSQLPVLVNPQVAPVQPNEILGNPVWYVAVLRGFYENPEWLILALATLLVVVLGFVFWYQDMRVRPPRKEKRTVLETILTIISFPLLPILTMIVVAFPTLQAQTMLMLGIPLQFRVTQKET